MDSMTPEQLVVEAIKSYKKMAEKANSPDEAAYFNLMAALIGGYIGWLKANVHRLTIMETMGAVTNAAAALVLDAAMNLAPPGSRVDRQVLVESFDEAIKAKDALPAIGGTNFPNKHN